MVERASGYDGVEWWASTRRAPRRLPRLGDMIERRVAGEPFQYVLGRWQFLGFDLFVDRRVLVPRPETEVVAQVAVEKRFASVCAADRARVAGRRRDRRR